MKNNKIIIVKPHVPENSPVSMRMSSLENYFTKNGFVLDIRLSPFYLKDKIKLIFEFIPGRNTIFITMPPFSIWPFFLMPFNRLVLDWRDVWSIGMEKGYGNTVKPMRFKAKIARLIEKIYLRHSFSIITCTKGLYDYHSNVHSDRFFYVPNGHFQKIDKNDFKTPNFLKNKFIVTCNGKFSEYGREKAENLIQTLRNRYKNNSIILNLIGSNIDDNAWVLDFCKLKDIDINFLPNIPYEESIQALKQSDLAAIIIRDTAYDFGTKVFDALSVGVPIINIFDQTNFGNYFAGCFDTDYNPQIAYQLALKHHRNHIAQNYLNKLVTHLKSAHS